MNYKTSECLDELRKTQWFSEEEVKKFQWARLENLLRHAYGSVPFYRTLFDSIALDVENGISIDEFRKIPLLDKEIIAKNKEKLISSRYKPSQLWLDTTSGSTGKKLVFYREKKGDKRNDYYRTAAFLRNMEWLGIGIFEKQASLWGAQMDLPRRKSFKNRIMNLIFPKLFLSSYNMTPKTMKSYAEKINRYKPKVLTGYASALYLFANYLDKKKIEIRGLKGIISTAETLYRYQRDKIERVFNCKVFERYGSREFGAIAHECEEHKGLHVNAEHVFVEILNEEGKPCKSGKLGKIVITDLDNYAFPFIRYNIEDIGILSDRKCPCLRGLQLIGKVEGRTWDVIVGANGNHLVGSFWLVKDVEGINQFQVIQEEFGKLILKLVVDKSFTEIEKQKLLNRIYDQCGKDMKVDIQLVDEIPIPDSGKHRFIISKVSPFIR